MEKLLDDRHITRFCKILGIEADQIERIYVNPGRSANNENFVFVVKGESYLYRVPGHGTALFCSREREALAYALLAPLNITDEVLYLDAKTGIKISNYYVDSRIPSSENKEELAACMRLLRKLHESDLDLDYTDSLFDRMERYRRYALEVGGDKFYLQGYDDYLDQMRFFKTTIHEDRPARCFTHGDASINNFLITREHADPILIDLEFPAMSDPYEDIATFCVDAEYRRDDILLMLEYYLRREPDDQERYRVLGLCAVAGMMWYSWAAYKSAVADNNQQFIGFRDDYHQYVGEVYAACESFY
ncbi:MAG TPA: phosphotransferase [Clostridia bacterium]|nr:phosphotransferase [Clostridia bacterium]